MRQKDGNSAGYFFFPQGQQADHLERMQPFTRVPPNWSSSIIMRRLSGSTTVGETNSKAEAANDHVTSGSLSTCDPPPQRQDFHFLAGITKFFNQSASRWVGYSRDHMSPVFAAVANFRMCCMCGSIIEHISKLLLPRPATVYLLKWKRNT